ncbi:MAG: hypothetical protein RLO80_12720 [Hyphomonas sp.]
MIDRLFQTAFTYETDDARSQQSALLWALGAPLILFPTFTFILSALWFTAGASLSFPAAWFILCTSAAGALYLPRVFLPGKSRLALLASLLLGALAFLISWLLYDTSIDGQHYHFQAIYALAEGWNPLRGDTQPPVIGDAISLWSIHYPRSGTVFSANLLAAGLPLTAAKPLNFLILFGAGLLATGTLMRCGFSALFAVFLSAAAIASPVVLGQLFTTMNDGALGLLMLVFTASMVAWIRNDDRLAAVIAAAAIILALNLKFSAIPIFVILCAFACIAAWRAQGQGSAIRLGAGLLATAFAAIVVLGWSPYMQNVLDHGHVFHPLMGAEAIDIMQGGEYTNTPEVVKDMSPVERFFFSLFSQSHAGYETVAHLKIPFTISVPELRMSGGVDVRLAGFGPFFSGAIILSAICAVLIYFRSAARNPVTQGLLLIALAMLVSVVLMPQNWWARYVPQFWFVPLAIAAAAITTERMPMRIFGAVIASILLFNGALTGAVSFWLTANRSIEVSTQINAMKEADQPFCIYPDMIQSRIHAIREAGIDIRYTPRDQIACPAPEEIAGYGPDRFGGAICACAD